MRIIAFVHDTFKYKEHKGHPRDWSRHHSVYRPEVSRQLFRRAVRKARNRNSTTKRTTAGVPSTCTTNPSKAKTRLNKLIGNLDPHLDQYYHFFWSDTRTGDKNLAPAALVRKDHQRHQSRFFLKAFYIFFDWETISRTVRLVVMYMYSRKHFHPLAQRIAALFICSTISFFGVPQNATFMLVMANNEPHTDYKRYLRMNCSPQIDALFTFAYHLTNYREEDANDLVQETYFKAYKAIDRYPPGHQCQSLVVPHTEEHLHQSVPQTL